MAEVTHDLYSSIMQTVHQAGRRHPFVVCGRSFMKNPAYKKLIEKSDVSMVPFHDYTPNPTYESVLKGLRLFQDEGCDMLISVGGGSPIDVAKSIKAFYKMDSDKPYVQQQIIPNDLPHLAIPTTAGTGSEATHFAVIYYNGTKYSVSNDSLIPDYVVLDPELLQSLPSYQRKVTMLDALCHAVESFWSVKSTVHSRSLAAQAILQFMSSYEDYLQNTSSGNAAMLQVSHLAGKAINLTTTTGAHAMSYKLTSLYGISHGHAVALCLPVLWDYMLKHIDQVCDPRGGAYVSSTFDKLAALLNQDSSEQAISFLKDLLVSLGLKRPVPSSAEELDLLSSSVNAQRLSNNPVSLTPADLRQIYQSILYTPSSIN